MNTNALRTLWLITGIFIILAAARLISRGPISQIDPLDKLLIAAIDRGDYLETRRLLKAGANSNAWGMQPPEPDYGIETWTRREEWSALMHAAKTGDPRIVKSLLQDMTQVQHY